MTDNEHDVNPTSDETTVETPVESPPVAQPADEAPTARGWRAQWCESRLGLAGAGVALALVFGVSGFAIGHATAGDDDRGWPGPGHHRFGEMRGDGPPPMWAPERPRQQGPQQPEPSGQPES